MAESLISVTQVVTIATALMSAGGIATLSAFDVPELQSQPASRSLPMTRWLFSRGSHVFPSSAILSTAGFLGLAVTSYLKSRTGHAAISVLEIWRVARNTTQVNGYLLAAALSLSIAPFTSQIMVPAVNFPLIEENEKLGGSRSAKGARMTESVERDGKGKTAEESVNGYDQPNQFTDLSGPQEKTPKSSSAQEDEKVREMLAEFGRLNNVRAVLMAAGGIVGLWTAINHTI